MTKKELIEELERQDVGDNEEILVSVVNAETHRHPLLVPIDYVDGRFINVIS